MNLKVQEERALRIVRHVASNIERTLTIAEVAGELGLSVSTVQRALRSVELSFRAVLTLARLENAERLLDDDPSTKVEILSLASGWRSRKSLYSAVWRKYRCGLAEWRAQLRERQLPT